MNNPFTEMLKEILKSGYPKPKASEGTVEMIELSPDVWAKKPSEPRS